MHLNSFFNFLSKNKLYTAINLFGLAVSLMFVILIADYSVKMLKVDRFHENADRIYLMGNESGYASNHYSATQIDGMFPEIEKICGVASYPVNAYVKEENTLRTPILFADSTFFEFFSFPAIYGDLSSALSSSDKVVITEGFALKMFGSTNVVGETIHLSGKETIHLTVSAVIKDLAFTILPLKTEVITIFRNSAHLAENDYNSPHVIINGWTSNKTFIMEKEGADLTAKKDEIYNYLMENDLDFKLSNRQELVLTPLPKVMLDPRNSDGGLERGNKQMLIILLSAGIAILIFAITNYINLTVAQTGFRAKEMACRRLLGGTKRSITQRLITESILMTAIAFVIGYTLAVIFQNYATTLCGATIDVVADLSPAVVGIYILFILLLGVVSGCIPAYTLTRFKPIDIVRGTLRYKSKMVFSKIFLIFQNAITIVLLVASTTIYLQINHLINAPLGHNVKGIIEGVDWMMSDSEYNTFKNELEKLPFVENVGLGKNSDLLGTSRSMQSFSDKDGNGRWITVMKLDSSAVNIFGLELISDHGAASEAVYINEEAAQSFGITPDETEFSIDYGGGEERKLLGGVYKNFRIGTVLDSYNPILINPITATTISDSYTTGCIIYIKVSGEENAALAEIIKVYNSVTSRDGGNSFNIAEEWVNMRFQKEHSTATIMLIFTIIAIIISALGLYAMSTYFTRQRIKEIGLRKIFGGTKDEILKKQLWEFMIPLLIALAVAIPAAYIIMDKWLQNYSYRISVYPWIFICAAIFIICIGILTVLGKTLKAVNSNPIKAIRTE